MFDFFTNLWQTLTAFLVGIPEAITGYLVEHPFMIGVTAVYVAGLIIALIVFRPKHSA